MLLVVINQLFKMRGWNSSKAEDRHMNSHRIASHKRVNICHQTVLNRLKKAGWKKSLDFWVPYESTQVNLLNRIHICETLKRNRAISKAVDTGWWKLNHIRQWCAKSYHGQSPKRLHNLWQSSDGRLRRLYMIWNWGKIVYYELLPPGRTID